MTTITATIGKHGTFATDSTVLDSVIKLRGIDPLHSLRESCAEILTGDPHADTHEDCGRSECLLIIASCKVQPEAAELLSGCGCTSTIKCDRHSTMADRAFPNVVPSVRVLATEADGRQTCHPELLTLGAAQRELNIMRAVPSIVRIEIRQGTLSGPVIVGWSRELHPVDCDCDTCIAERRAAIKGVKIPGAGHPGFAMNRCPRCAAPLTDPGHAARHETVCARMAARDVEPATESGAARITKRLRAAGF